MAGSANATIDHDEIRAWVQARGGCPARVKSTGRDSDPGILRIDYTGFSGKDTLEKISWDEFFEWFDENELAFLHQDTTSSGKQSRFSKLIRRSGNSAAPRSDGAEKEEQKSDEPPLPSEDPAELLQQQHDELRGLFAQLEGGDIGVAPELLNALGLHLALEEAIVYPVLLDGELEDEIRESVVEHIGAKRLVRDLVDAPAIDESWWASVRVLRRQIEEHMEREEEDVLPTMRDRLDDAQRTALMQEMEAFTAETLDTSPDAPLESALSNTDARLEQP